MNRPYVLISTIKEFEAVFKAFYTEDCWITICEGTEGGYLVNFSNDYVFMGVRVLTGQTVVLTANNIVAQKQANRCLSRQIDYCENPSDLTIEKNKVTIN